MGRDERINKEQRMAEANKRWDISVKRTVPRDSEDGLEGTVVAESFEDVITPGVNGAGQFIIQNEKMALYFPVQQLIELRLTARPDKPEILIPKLVQ